MGTPLTISENGVDADRLDLLLRRVRLEVDAGPLPSAQVAVARNGQLVVSETYGEAAPHHRYILQSVSRVILGPTMWKLIGDGLLDLSERVADIIPEFGTNGKDVVTVEHVLTHTSGFPQAPLGYPKMLDRSARLEAFGQWRLTSVPGARLEYHLTSAAWVLAEIVERRTGLSFGEYLKTELCTPLGLTIQVGVDADEQAETVVAPVAIDAADGREVDPWGPWFTARPEVLAAGEPSHSVVGTAADVAMWLQAVMFSGLWDPAVVREGTRPRVSQIPVVDYGNRGLTHMALFVVVANGSRHPDFPVTASPSTWGHAGAPCQLAFMDPEHSLSFAFLTNGYPTDGDDQSRSGYNRRTLIANLAGDLVPWP